MNRAIKIALASVYALVVLAVAYEIARWTARREMQIARRKDMAARAKLHFSKRVKK